MKRTSFCFFLALFIFGTSFPDPLFGQKPADPVEFKIMGGASLSRSTEPLGWILIEDYPIAKYGLGIVAGGGAELPLIRNVTFEIDALFFQRACRIELRSIFDDVPIERFTERLNEISFPLLFKFCLRPGTSPYLLGGGEIAPVLSTRPLRVDYGLVCGLGFRKKVKGSTLSLEGRYHHGLQDTLIGNVVLRKMRAFALMVGFSL